jgi:hypothetical protein
MLGSENIRTPLQAHELLHDPYRNLELRMEAEGFSSRLSSYLSS